MSLYRHVLLAATLGTATACSSRSATSADVHLQPGAWGSDQATLTVRDNGATLRILALLGMAGACYGSYGDINQQIPAGPFDLPGSYTQLIGAYPGSIQYAAHYSGSAQGNELSVTITVPDLERTFGPYTLTYGVSANWNPCLFP